MKTIDITGSIVSDDYGRYYDKYNIPCCYPAKVKDILAKANGEDIEININSGGGNIFAGFEIYTAILTYKGNVKINVTGLAASAASVIMCAGECRISPVGTVMIHCCSTYSEGNRIDMEKTAEMLGTVDDNIANAYIAKTGMSRENALAMMEKTTWLTADKAVEIGLCSGFIEKVNTSAQAGEKSPDSKKIDKTAQAKARAKFLKMKGETKNV